MENRIEAEFICSPFSHVGWLLYLNVCSACPPCTKVVATRSEETLALLMSAGDRACRVPNSIAPRASGEI